MMDARSTLSRMPTLRARRPRRLTPLALAPVTVLLVALVGCSDTPEIPQADPTPSASPLFASEEEALDAATAVYEEFLAVTGEILRNGGEGAESLEPLVSPEVFEQENEGFLSLQESGGRTDGQNRLEGIRLQQIAMGDPESFELQAYVCVNNTDARLIDGDGNDITNPDRTEVITLEVVFGSDPSGSLIIEAKDYWADGNECDA